MQGRRGLKPSQQDLWGGDGLCTLHLPKVWGRRWCFVTWGKPPVQGASRGRADHEIHLRNSLFLFVAECIPFQRDHL